MRKLLSIALILLLTALLVLSMSNVVITAPRGIEAGTLMSEGGFAAAAQDNPSPPASPVRLIFIHHSCGENWLEDSNGGLGIALRDNNYFVSDTNYGWGPDSIGDNTDIGNWWDWFRGPDSPTYLATLYAESGQNSSYSRLGSSPGGENQVIMFKSCFPNSALGGSPSDPVPPIGSNPLKGGSSPLTVANAKGIYIDLLEYFKTRPDKLFIAVTAPPLRNGTWAANARAFNNWLVNDWLAGYPLSNVFVFDFYNVLTSNGGSANVNDLGWETGNHHRWWNNAVQHKTDGGWNTLAYPTGDDHPSGAGNRKATAEFAALLNVAYNRFLSGGNLPHIDSISPAMGPVGTEVTINGSRFGDSRDSSYVSFESTPATQYNQWTDTRIRCLVPAGALSGWLKVTTTGGTSNGVNYVIPLPSVASSFYFAEGYTGANFEEWLCLLNYEGAMARAQVTYLYADGTAPFTRDYQVPGNSRVTLHVNREAGAGKDVSVKLESDGKVLAERPMYFNYKGAWSGGSDVIGAPAPSTSWYFAEGCTIPGFEEWICVLNPGDSRAGMAFYFQTQETGERRVGGLSVEAHSRRTFKANDLLGGVPYQTSLAIESSQPIVAERPMYFDYRGASEGAGDCDGGHCVMGASALSREYFFAEGNTRPGFDAWLTLQNPAQTAITVEASFQPGSGQGEPSYRTYDVQPGSRRTLYLPDEAGRGRDVSVKLSSDSDFLAERPMYFNYGYGGLAANGGHCTIGADATAPDWLLAEGYTGSDFHEWICLQNPGDLACVVEVNYYTTEAGTLPVRTVAIPARTRVSLMVNQHAGPGYQLATRVKVISGPDIVVERPMYFRYNGVWDGGHDVVGYSP